jgi:hypothetical protein
MVRCTRCSALLVALSLLLAALAQLVLRSGSYGHARYTSRSRGGIPSEQLASERGDLVISKVRTRALSSMDSLPPPPPPPPPARAVDLAVASQRGLSSSPDCAAGPKFEHLQLNEPAQRLWQCSGALQESSVKAVFLTFGSHSMADFLLNWVAHVKRLDQRLYLVGALDAKLAALCLEHGIPAATISDETLAKMGANRLSKSAEKTYYRYAPGTFLRMGLIKQVFIREMLLAGLDAMVSDVDVAWLRSPWPLVRYGDRAQPAVQGRCKLIAFADVVLSVDQVQQYMDTDKHYWHIGSELNTGVAFFRNSAGALAVLDEWRVAMAKAIAAGNPNHDQFWLNEVLQKRDFVNLKLDDAARAKWLPGALAALRQADPTREGLPTSATDFNASEASLRALFLFKRQFGVPPAAKAEVTIATFPIAEVSNGHTFFIQKLHEIVGVPPVCVHTTYQYGDSPTYAYGKRERLRDAHLWLLDSAQSHWEGRFLQLTTMPARQLSPMKAELLMESVVDPEHCVRSHLKLTMLQRQWLMDGFLLAKALGRTLILPPLWCMLDRFWTILNHCLIGSQVEMPQPFVCPLDHSFNIPSMVSAGLEWREHSFLSNPTAPPGLAASAVSVRVASGPPHTEMAANDVSAPSGSTFAQLVGAVRASSSAQAARLLRIDASDLGRLCRCLHGLPEVHDLARQLPRLLSSDFHYCDTTDNPYFVECKRHRRQGCRKHKTYLMNVSRGMQAPPAMPTADCSSSCLAYALPKSHITEGVVGATSV